MKTNFLIVGAEGVKPGACGPRLDRAAVTVETCWLLRPGRWAVGVNICRVFGGCSFVATLSRRRWASSFCSGITRWNSPPISPGSADLGPAPRLAKLKRRDALLARGAAPKCQQTQNLPAVSSNKLLSCGRRQPACSN